MDVAKFPLPPKFRGHDRSIWNEYYNLAMKYKPINLGLGFPDFNPPEDITSVLEAVAKDDNPLIHQYARPSGHPPLVKQLSKLYSQFVGREINEFTEVLVTFGAYEALYCAISGFVAPGDEVIIIEPYFDCYDTMVRIAGGIPKYIPLRPKHKDATNSADWYLDKDDLESLFNENTKMIILNTPHNPLGKIFKLDELEVIANLCKKFNVICVADEVYEWLIFDSNKHIRIASLPEMWERTITIASAGKTFSVTGWHTGWAYGPETLMRNLQTIHQLCIYTCCTPIQEAIARILEKEIHRLDSDDSYFKVMAKKSQKKRDYTVKFLADAGMKPIIPEGGFFITTDWSPLASKIQLETDESPDIKFTKWLAMNVGILGMPPSVFYNEQHKHLAHYLARFCFIKKEENLQKAAELIGKWKTQIKE